MLTSDREITEKFKKIILWIKISDFLIDVPKTIKIPRSFLKNSAILTTF